MRRWAFPVFLDLHGRKVVVVGNGSVAESKVRELLEAGARVTLISDAPSPDLSEAAAQERVVHLHRPFAPDDLAHAALAVAERSDRATHQALARDAERHGVFLNVQDEIEFCSWSAAAQVRQGALTVVIGTDGKAPALAVRLKEALQHWLGPEYARFLEIAGRLRAPLARTEPSFGERRRIWYELVDSDLLALLRAGDEAGADAMVARITGLPSSTWSDAHSPAPAAESPRREPAHA